MEEMKNRMLSIELLLKAGSKTIDLELTLSARLDSKEANMIWIEASGLFDISPKPRLLIDLVEPALKNGTIKNREEGTYVITREISIIERQY